MSCTASLHLRAVLTAQPVQCTCLYADGCVSLVDRRSGVHRVVCVVALHCSFTSFLCSWLAPLDACIFGVGHFILQCGVSTHMNGLVCSPSLLLCLTKHSPSLTNTNSHLMALTWLLHWSILALCVLGDQGGANQTSSNQFIIMYWCCTLCCMLLFCSVQEKFNLLAVIECHGGVLVR